MPTRNIPVYNLLIIYQNLRMKKVSKVSAVFIIFLILSCIPSEPTIIGKWTLHTHDDNEVIATFNNDGTYNAEGSTGEQEVSRKYLVTKDTLAINDEGCNENIWGKYKLTFYEEFADKNTITRKKGRHTQRHKIQNLPAHIVESMLVVIFSRSIWPLPAQEMFQHL